MCYHRISRPVFRRGMRAIRRRAPLGAATILTAGVLLLAPTAVPAGVPTATAKDCADVEVIFARGTAEPPGLGRVGDAFVEALRQDTGMSVDAYGVNYPASRLQLHGGDGAHDAIARVKTIADQCPGTKIVLGGYSQGASVMDIVAGVPVEGISFGDPLPAQYADHVAAVATFGNIVGRSGVPMSGQSALLGAKAIDLCNPTDPICHAGPGNQWSGHTNGYVPEYTNQAATFVAGKL